MKYILKGFSRKIKKKKLKIFKTTYLKRVLAQGITRMHTLGYSFFKKHNPTDRVLIVSPDALGDAVVKSTTMKKIGEYYGKNNLYIATSPKWEEIWKGLGYNTIRLPHGGGLYAKISGGIRYYNRVNSLDFKKIVMFKHAYSDGKPDPNYLCRDQVDIDKTQETGKEYVLYDHLKLLKLLLKRDYNLEEIKPDIRELFSDLTKEGYISVGIGAASEEKSLPQKKMIEILDFLEEKFPGEKILLLGRGKRQAAYTEEVMRASKNRSLENMVDKVSLLKTIELVGRSRFFLGYDSGLSNCSLALDQKTVILFWTDRSSWKHQYPHVRLIMGDGKDPVYDGYQGTPMLNSIKTFQIEEALKELKVID